MERRGACLLTASDQISFLPTYSDKDSINPQCALSVCKREVGTGWERLRMQEGLTSDEDVFYDTLESFEDNEEQFFEAVSGGCCQTRVVTRRNSSGVCPGPLVEFRGVEGGLSGSGSVVLTL